MIGTATAVLLLQDQGLAHLIGDPALAVVHSPADHPGGDFGGLAEVVADLQSGYGFGSGASKLSSCSSTPRAVAAVEPEASSTRAAAVSPASS